MRFKQIKENKEEYIKFRVTKSQKDLIKHICDIKNMNISEYVIYLINKDINENNYVE